MFFQYKAQNNNEKLEVCGIPFSVYRDERGVVRKINNETLAFEAECDVLFFLGMSTDSAYCCEWWAQDEALYDHSMRVFLGDRLMRIRVIFEDMTEELISVIFGVNTWNYNLYYKPHDRENIPSWASPYREPFASDENASRLKDASLMLMENTDVQAEHCTKWVFGYRLHPGKKIKEIMLVKEHAKKANIAISAITGVLSGTSVDETWKIVDQSFFLQRKYFRNLYNLAHRLYQYKEDLPKSDAKIYIENFDAPDIVFTGSPMAEVYTNVYRVNIMDMAYNKIDDDGRSHTSIPNGANFGCYIGFGTYNEGRDAKGGNPWSRDVGRTLMELTNSGYKNRVLPAVDYLHRHLYDESARFPIPHWKRVADLVITDDKDFFLDGNENDGHAAIMLFVYTLYRKGIVGKQWLIEHKKELKDAANYYVWQKDNPKLSNCDGIFYSHSETSTQLTGGYDLFSNIISAYALEGYSKLFYAIGEDEYAENLYNLACQTKINARCKFTMDHPKYGYILTDTTDDCWTYEYKRMIDLLIYSDIVGYDMLLENPELHDLLSRTFDAQKDLFYHPESGRQMGYGQGYLTQCAIMLDRYDELTECIEAAAMFCYHHTDHNYIVPEGVIVHGSKRFWYRNADHGNAVQQAEIVKCSRLLLGIDDIVPERGLRLIPRLPITWQTMEVTRYPVTGADKKISYINFSYKRGKHSGKVVASDGMDTYTADWEYDNEVDCIRMGPFFSQSIEVTGGSSVEVKKICDSFFAYVKA